MASSVGTGRSNKMGQKIIAACGNDCAACPRYCKEPYEKTEEALRRTAKLWYEIGYRDHVVTREEISCTGCKPDSWCRYGIVSCVTQKGLQNCGQCGQYPCEQVLECFRVTKSFEPACRKACTEEEYRQMKAAFFEKEENLTPR